MMKSKMPVSAAVVLLALVIGVACTTTPEPEETYVTDYRIVDERTVKYLYLTGERSLGGSSYGDQALALEICTVRREIDDDSDELGDVVETDCESTRILKTEEYR